MLQIPSHTEMQSLSKAEAERVFAQHQEQWKAHLATGEEIVCPPVSETTTAEAATAETQAAAAEPAPAATETQAAAPEPAPAAAETQPAAAEPEPAATETQAAAPEPAPAAAETQPAASEPALAAAETTQPTAAEPAPAPAESKLDKAVADVEEDATVTREALEDAIARKPVWISIVIAILVAAAVISWIFGRKKAKPAPSEPTAKTGEDFDKLDVNDTLSKLNTTADAGLTEAEAKNRLQEYGENALQEETTSAWQKLLSFFWGPIPWMIEAAAVLSAVVQHWDDFTIIVLMLVINAAIGFSQEFKADNEIAALKQKLAQGARALRDGAWKDIPAASLVPGDIIQLKLGNIIPADVKLISGSYLSVDQAALTGEALPVNKQTGDSAYSGSVIKMGEMRAVVTGTGMNTFFGRTAGLAQQAQTVSHFQQAVLKIGNFLIYVTLAVIGLIFAVGLARGEHFGSLLIFALVLTVAGIPVALPAVLSVTMAIGASRLSKLKAIVSKLVAIEEMAGMDILCSDKTGTLTQNRLTLTDVTCFDGTREEDLLLAAALASNTDGTDAIDEAIVQRMGDRDKLKTYKIGNFLPFDPIGKRTEAEVSDADGKQFKVTKGAPQVILALANPTPELSQQASAEVERQAEKGFRTLGVARTEEDGSWRFLGMLPLFDPPREDSRETIETLREMGVDVKMVTGDHTAIARQVSEQLSLGTDITPAPQVFGDNAPANLAEMVEHADGFAEVFPEHKYEIVSTLQGTGRHIVGMTGDGVNDAPALKKADIGVAVSGATDAARAAADLVLTAPGLSVIARATEEARRIFGRMVSYSTYRISATVSLLLFMTLCILMFQFYPLTAVMVVLIALLNDLPIMSIAYDRVEASEKPSKWDMKQVLIIAVGLALTNVVSWFGLYWLCNHHWHLGVTQTQTVIFAGVLIGSNLTLYLSRNRGWLWSRPLPGLPLATATLATQIVGLVIAALGIYVSPIGWAIALQVYVYLLIWCLINGLLKMGLYELLDRGARSLMPQSRAVARVTASLG
jgi:H+-transporting ATPase